MAKNATTDDHVQPIERAREVAQEVIEKAREGYDSTREKLHAVGDEVGKKYEKISEDVRRRAEHASQVARERYNETAEVVRTRYKKVRKDMDGLAADVNTYVKDNPGKAVLIAAGAGFLLGFLLRGRHHEE